jgi:hypothetical protein
MQTCHEKVMAGSRNWQTIRSHHTSHDDSATCSARKHPATCRSAAAAGAALTEPSAGARAAGRGKSGDG